MLCKFDDSDHPADVTKDVSKRWNCCRLTLLLKSLSSGSKSVVGVANTSIVGAMQRGGDVCVA